MNKTADYTFTIIVPVYNEVDNMSALEEKLKAFLPNSIYKACVLFVDDGSSDGSKEAIHNICSRNKDFFYIGYTKNGGLSAAMKAGIDTVESKYLGYMDADLQTTPDDFNLLLAEISNNPLVIGIRAKRKDTYFKRLQSKIANSFRRSMTHDGATDTGCPLKVIQSDYAKRMPFFTGMHRFIPALILLQDGGSFKEIPVHHFPRVAGKSKYHLWNRLISPLKDCFAYRWMAHRYINYHIDDSNI